MYWIEGEERKVEQLCLSDFCNQLMLFAHMIVTCIVQL